MHQPRFPRIAEMFVGRYQIEEIIGAGGFSQVYRATQADLGRPVAIKVLKSVVDPTKTEAEREQKFEQVSRRFEREARLISRLKDRNTVMMYDYGTTEDGLLFMVLEYVDGITISELLHRDGALDAKRVVKILRQALTSLHEAHSLGVLHRDIKPGNVMVYDHVGRFDQVKVLDFGIAKTVDRGDGSNHTTSGDVTADGVLVGTPRYMSPEQIRGKRLGAGSDVYSLGLLAYEMLNGTKAVDADSSLRIIARHLDTEPINLPPDMSVPSRLRTIINKMLLKDPTDRYQSCDEVIRDLEHWDEDVVPASHRDTTMTVDGMSLSHEIETEKKERSNNRLVVFGIVAMLLVIVALVTVPSILRDRPPAEDATAEVTPQPDGPGESEPVAVVEPAIGNQDQEKAEKRTPAEDEADEPVDDSAAEEAAAIKEAAAEAARAAEEQAALAEKAEREEAQAEAVRQRERRERRRRARDTNDKRTSESSGKVKKEEPVFKPFAVD